MCGTIPWCCSHLPIPSCVPFPVVFLDGLLNIISCLNKAPGWLCTAAHSRYPRQFKEEMFPAATPIKRSLQAEVPPILVQMKLPRFRTFLQWIPPLLSSPWLLGRPLLLSLNTQVCLAHPILGILRLAGTPALHPRSKNHSASLRIHSKEQLMTEPLTELLKEPAAHFAEKKKGWNEGVGDKHLTFCTARFMAPKPYYY